MSILITNKSSSGSNTLITNWTTYSPILTATTTNPTKGTIATDQGYTRRVGDSADIRYDFSQTSAGTAGSGSYLFSIPAGLTIDSSKIGTTGGNGMHVVGTWAAFDGSVNYTGAVTVVSSTQISLQFGNVTVGQATIASNFVGLSGATIRYSFVATIPMTQYAF